MSLKQRVFTYFVKEIDRQTQLADKENVSFYNTDKANDVYWCYFQNGLLHKQPLSELLPLYDIQTNNYTQKYITKIRHKTHTENQENCKC